jgi:hypothetical protein
LGWCLIWFWKHSLGYNQQDKERDKIKGEEIKVFNGSKVEAKKKGYETKLYIMIKRVEP